jgi:uncharacterized protein (DUF111 family)
MTATQHANIVVVDGQAGGVAGDMFLGALVDLGANVDRIVAAIKSLEQPEYGYSDVQVKVEKVKRGDFCATQIDTTAKCTGKKSSEPKALLQAWVVRL